MAAETKSPTELDAFQQFINERHGGSLNGHTLEEAIDLFRRYSRQLAQLREKTRMSEESAEREGTFKMTDERVAATFERLDAKLAEEGISD